jgi:hypothetical protein
MKLLGLALALQMFFPVFDNSNGNYASLALTNVSHVDAEFTVRLNSPNGQPTNLVRIAIEAGQQRILGVDSLRPRSETPMEGWISVEATTDRFTAYLASGTIDALAAIEPASRLAVTTYLPHVRVQKAVAETNQTETLVAIVNPLEQTANVSIRLSSYDRSVAQTVFAQVPAQGSRLFRVSELLPSGTTFFDGRATVHSFSPLAVWEKVETPSSWTALRARSDADFSLDTSLTAPFFVFGGAYQSFLTLWNPTEPPIALELTAYDRQGGLLGERVRITLEPGQAISSAIDSLFRVPIIASVPPPVIVGSVKVREIDNRPFRMFSTMETRSVDAVSRASMLYWLSSSAAQTWEIPFVAQNERFYTGYSILAVNEFGASPTNVTIEVHDLNGALVQHVERSLPPLALDAALIAPILPGAYIRIWSTQPISVVGTVGTHDGSLIEAVMPSR